jgi:hypothetical protein
MFESAQGIISFVDELGTTKIVRINISSVWLDTIFVIDSLQSNSVRGAVSLRK